MNDSIALLVVYALVSIRFLGLILTSPVFSPPSMPIPFRFFMALLFALAATPPDATVPLEPLSHWIGFTLAAGRELAIGAAVGFFSSLPLYALQMSGFLEGTQVGLAMATLYDPMSEAQVSLIGQFKNLVGLWFFFRWDGHMLLIQGLSESLRLVPLAPSGGVVLPPDFGAWLAAAVALALKISLPVVASLLLADVGLGFVARTVPQMNVLVLGLPLKFGLGFFLLIAVLPLAVDLLHEGIEPALEWSLRLAVWWR